jgi:hypothetical protein
VRYGTLLFYALVLAAAYGFMRPGSRAGKAVTAVTGSLSGVLGKREGGGSQ